ncbi:3-isopropylmalate dehydratase small subunit [Sulfitobacter sp.]|uniref:3-isopropylmalate dehydratase small subunit n=1 Tax=Sulfitobacter sp. TaxID=1903071 RepID=UPI000C529B21|nr:3-isopropylmalate dehydratase small subunit [Roseobacter sp.]
MSGWTQINGRAVALPQANIDTDQLIPARFMSAPRADGYGGFLLHDIRQDDADHILNRYTNIDIVVTRRNFGSGSSREAAVYALVDFGIKAVFAPSFGDIFRSNAVNNGLLPAQLPEDDIEALIAVIGREDADATVDLSASTVQIAGQEFSFELDPVWRKKLVNGWDDIDLTTQHDDEIQAFRAARFAAHPWALPAS